MNQSQTYRERIIIIVRHNGMLLLGLGRADGILILFSWGRLGGCTFENSAPFKFKSGRVRAEGESKGRRGRIFGEDCLLLYSVLGLDLRQFNALKHTSGVFLAASQIVTGIWPTKESVRQSFARTRLYFTLVGWGRFLLWTTAGIRVRSQKSPSLE